MASERGPHSLHNMPPGELQCGLVPLLSWSSRSLRPHAGSLPLLRAFRLVLMLAGSCAPDGIIGASPQIDVDVVNITHHIFVDAKGGHYKVLSSVYLPFSGRNHGQIICIALCFERACQRWCVGRACAVWPVAPQALRIVTSESGICVPVNCAVRFDTISRNALGIVKLAIFIFNSCRITRPLRYGHAAPKQRYQDQRTCAGAGLHVRVHFRLMVKKPGFLRRVMARRSVSALASFRVAQGSANTVSCPPSAV